MTVYIIASFISVVFASLSKNYNLMDSVKENKNKRFSFAMFISLVSMFIVSALRYNVGTDYINYVAGFFRTYSSGHYEILFVLLQNAIKIFTNDHQWLFIITSLLFVFFAYKSIYDQSKNYGLSVFLLIFGTYYFQSLNHIRFMIAVAIFMYSIKYLTMRKFKFFLISILVAAGFHRIFIVLIPIYWLYNKKIKTRHIIIGAMILAIALWNLDIILSRINVFEVYSIYLQTEKHAAQTLWGLLFMNGVVLAFYSIYWKKGKGSLLYRFYFNMQFISFLLSIMSGMIPLAGRLVVIFRIIQIFGIPYVLKMEKSKYMRVILTSFIVLSFLMYTYYAIYLMNGHGVLPYQFIK